MRLTSFDGQRYYSFDGLGSATALTDELGAVKVNLHLDAWGVLRNPSELTGQNRVAFTGYFFSKSTNLYYAKARWYDAEVGRFTTQDSYLGQPDDPPSLHRFFYGNANPTRFTDPTGHYSWDELKRDAKAVAIDVGRAAVKVEQRSIEMMGGPVLTLINRSAERGSLKAGAKDVLNETFNQFGGYDAAKRVYDEGRGVPKAIEEGVRTSAANAVADVIPVRDVADMLDDRLSPWQRAEAGAKTVYKGASLLAGLVKGAPRAAVVEESASGEAAALAMPDEAKITEMLGRLPARSGRDKTSGTLEMNTGGQLDIKSGVQGPGELMPPGFGFIRQPGTATHVEGHSAAAMRGSGATEANLYINNIPCAGPLGCAAQLPKMLPPGAKLNVFGPNGYFRSFVGAADPRPFPMRVGPWVPNRQGSFMIDNPDSGVSH